MAVLTLKASARFRLSDSSLAAHLIGRDIEPCGIHHHHAGGFAAALVSRFEDAWEARAIIAPPGVRPVLYPLGRDALILALRETELPPRLSWPLRQVATFSFEVDEVACFGDESFGDAVQHFASCFVEPKCSTRLSPQSPTAATTLLDSHSAGQRSTAGCGSGARELRTLRVRSGRESLPHPARALPRRYPMIEPRCPDCISPEIEPDPDCATGEWRCSNCGTRFEFENAFVRLGEAMDFRSEMEPEPLFHFHRTLAQIELRACDGVLRVLNPYSDVEELHRILDAALARRVIEARRPRAALHAYLFPGAEPHPVLGVDPGVGAELVGPELALQERPGEDPISFTVRWLEQIVESANRLLGRRLQGES